MLSVFDFGKHWDMVKPHLENPVLMSILDRDMKLLERYGITWDGRPWLASAQVSDYWDNKPEPEEGSVEFYKAVGLCHWIAAWQAGLGRLLFTQMEWKVLRSQNHSIALGDDKLIFDIIEYNQLTASEIMKKVMKGVIHNVG